MIISDALIWLKIRDTVPSKLRLTVTCASEWKIHKSHRKIFLLGRPERTFPPSHRFYGITLRPKQQIC